MLAQIKCCNCFFRTKLGRNHTAAKAAQAAKLAPAKKEVADDFYDGSSPITRTKSWMVAVDADADADAKNDLEDAIVPAHFVLVEMLTNHVVIGVVLMPAHSSRAFASFVLFVTLVTNMCACALALDVQGILLMCGVCFVSSIQKRILFYLFACIQRRQKSRCRLYFMLICSCMLLSLSYVVVSLALGFYFLRSQDIIVPWLINFGMTLGFSCFVSEPLLSLIRCICVETEQEHMQELQLGTSFLQHYSQPRQQHTRI